MHFSESSPNINQMLAQRADGEIILRLVELSDADELFALTDSNRLYLREWLPWLDATQSAQDSIRFIESAQQQLERKDGFQICVRCLGRIVGMIGLHRIERANRSTSIGYWLGQSFQGRGVMTRACRALVDYALNELRLNRVEIRCATGNLKSRAIAERLGFQNEGVVREAEWLYTRFVDLMIYGMLASEWTTVSSACGKPRRS